eukprot:CAMPEP_0118725222 /NCGR_PEP_ID=MMETSP0800-20121206/33023_1 /TAXON_ID=210618 ORGANISM="Striatella unipunctata, Strain CCMP2910" /NCGR_SAMPLE_ID=MMETSP0800 /ASSEMBLY_ACC=CAM_ASM_000638 /LENGTH=90 /DNA_ID=CAMNT_0006633903 /DNA_START=166 /DNA_END=438 /DNA_ORIENTATION=+
MDQIKKYRMQDPKTGAFVPQSKEYLTKIPGPDLANAFQDAASNHPRRIKGTPWPQITYINAQRWGSALPSHHSLRYNKDSGTQEVISEVP